MTELNRRISSIRRSRNDIENHIIDEYAAGRIDRREFFRRGTVAGMSIPLLGLLAAACGGSSSSSSSSSSGGAAPATSAAAGGGKTGGTVRISILKPANAVDPVLANNTGSLALVSLTGEFLTMDEDKQLKPWLAESWTSNADASEWTFKIKSGVKFNDGTPMTAKDVAATFNRLADPKNKSNALSTLGGYLSAGGATAPDDTTVVFKLDAPNGGWPYATSNDNYNAIILPASYAGDFTKTWPGTGPWKNTAYTAGQSATFTANPDYWGPKAKQATLQVTLHPDEGSQVTALQSGQVDAIQQISVSGGQAILNDPSYTILSLQASTHRQLSMRCDKDPFTDKRVRQAIALTLDRPQIVQGLFQGKSDLGNDSPFAPVFAQTDTSVPQRAQDIATGQAAPRRRRPPERLLDAARRRRHAGDEGLRAARRGIGEADRRQHQPQDRGRRRLLRQHLRLVGLARLDHEPRRLRPPRRPEPVPAGPAPDLQREEGHGRLERGALRERPVRRAGEPVHRRDRPAVAEGLRGADRDAAARRDADHLRLLLQLPRGREEERAGLARVRDVPDLAGPGDALAPRRRAGTGPPGAPPPPRCSASSSAASPSGSSRSGSSASSSSSARGSCRGTRAARFSARSPTRAR